MIDNPQIYCTSVNNFNDFSRCLSFFNENWLFRGHADAQWSLSTSLERSYDDYYKEFTKELEQHSPSSRCFAQSKHLAISFIVVESTMWIARLNRHGNPG